MLSAMPPVVIVVQEIRSWDQPCSQRCAAVEYQDQQPKAQRIRISPPRRSKGLPVRVKSTVAKMQPQMARIKPGSMRLSRRRLKIRRSVNVATAGLAALRIAAVTGFAWATPSV